MKYVRSCLCLANRSKGGWRTSARLFQSFTGSAGSVAKIIGDYRNVYTSAPSVNRAWATGGSSRASSSSRCSASERCSLPPNPLLYQSVVPGSEALLDDGGLTRGTMKIAAEEAEETQQNRCDK